MPIPFLTVVLLLGKHPVGNPGGGFKFVQVNNEYRFVELLALKWVPSHSDLVDDNEIAQSAGMIYIGTDYWELTDPYSVTLKIGVTEVDCEKLTHLLQRKQQIL